MKTSLSHLPADKQEQIHQIVAIIKEIAIPEKIILFGSYAKGNYKEHEYTGKDGIRYQYFSDYDFLVVTEKNTLKPYEIEGAIEDRGRSKKIAVSIELHEIDYINEGLGFGQYFFTDILNEGVLLYDTGRFEFNQPHELTSEEKKIISQRYYDIWFPQGREFILDGSNALERGSYKKAAFEFHQAAESFYNAMLLVFTSYKPKTHNLWKLRKRAKELSSEYFKIFDAENNKYDNYLFDLLKRGYIDARYKSDYIILKQECVSILERLIQMEQMTKEICTQQIKAY